jgi:hypothetical protein
MKQYNKYLISEGDQFDPNNFISAVNEIQKINEDTESCSPLHKADILISFLKDHSLFVKWEEENPQLTKLLTSGSLATGNLEALFQSCRNLPNFRSQLDLFLKESFSGNNKSVYSFAVTL